jgi:hypothetical protein
LTSFEAVSGEIGADDISCWFSAGLAPLRTCSCPVFGIELFTDCSLTSDLSATAMSDVENLHHVTLDRKQDPVDVRAAAIEQLPYFNR